MDKKVGIFWDWNGTLIDDAFIFVEIMNVFLKQRDLDIINIKKYRDCFEFPIANYYKKLGFNFKKETFKEVGVDFIKQYKAKRFQADFFPQIKNLLSLLKQKGVHNFIVSAQEHSLLCSAVDHYGVGQYFKDFLGVDNISALGKVENAKKLKEKYKHCLDKIIVVGDTPHDMEMAQAVDGFGILVSYGHYSKKRLLNEDFVVVDSVEDLKNIVLLKIN